MSRFFCLVCEKVQNCAVYVGAQFIEPEDNGFDKSNPYERKWYFFRDFFVGKFGGPKNLGSGRRLTTFVKTVVFLSFTSLFHSNLYFETSSLVGIG